MSTTEKINRPRYIVWTQDQGEDEPTRHQVQVTVQDRLRAEQTAARLGLPGIGDAQQTHVALWCWAALRRTQVTEHGAEHWLNQVLVDFDQDEPAGEPVDPTQQAATSA